jgi:hypothetical protein
MAEPGQAPPQDIIALYLQGRDVPCPACGYNRRDDTTPPCPECGHHLRLQPVARNPLELTRTSCYWLAGIIIVQAAMVVPLQTIDLVRMIVIQGQSLAQMWIVQNIAVNLGYSVGAIFATLCILRIRRRHPHAARAATIAAAAVLAGFSVPILALLSDLF